MSHSVEMVTGLGSNDPSYGYAAIRPPLGPAAAEELRDLLSGFNHATELGEETEIVMQADNETDTSTDWFMDRANQIHDYLKANGYSVHWMNPMWSGQLRVSGEQSLFDFFEAKQKIESA